MMYQRIEFRGVASKWERRLAYAVTRIEMILPSDTCSLWKR